VAGKPKGGLGGGCGSQRSLKVGGFKSKANAISQAKMRSMLFDSGETARKRNLLTTEIEMVWSLNARLVSGARTSSGQVPGQIAYYAEVIGIPKPLEWDRREVMTSIYSRS
jgi:hypothetical protein